MTAVGSEPGLIVGVVAAMGSEPRLIVWHGGRDGIRTRTDCVVWLERTRTDCVAWRDQNQD